MRNYAFLRRFGAMAVALVMAFALSVPAFAAGSTYDVQINNAAVGTKYKLYRVLEVDTKDADEDGKIDTYQYSIPATDAGKAVFDVVKGKFDVVETDKPYFRVVNDEILVYIQNNDPTKDEFVAVDGTELNSAGQTEEEFKAARATELENAKNAFMSAFSDALRTAILTAKVMPDYEGTMDEASGSTMTFEGVPAGYYVLESDAGTTTMLFTNASDGSTVVVNEKNKKPTLAKWVWDKDDTRDETDETVINGQTYHLAYDFCYAEGGCANDYQVRNGSAWEKVLKDETPIHLGSWKKVNDVNVGEVVQYKIEVNVEASVEELSVEDILDEGLAFVGIDSIIFDMKGDRTVYGNDEEKTPVTQVGLVESKDGVDGHYSVTTAAEGEKTKVVIDFDKDSFLLYENPVNRDDGMYNPFVGNPNTTEDDGGTLEIRYSVRLTDDVFGHKVAGSNRYEAQNNAVANYKYKNDLTENETNRDRTTTSTYEVDLLKYTGSEDTILGGAKFYLTTEIVAMSSDGNSNGDSASFKIEKGRYDALLGYAGLTSETDIRALSMSNLGYSGLLCLCEIDDSTVEGKVYRPWVQGEDDDSLAIRVFETPAEGKVYIRGIDAGMYAFNESAAPAGYNRLSDPVVFAVANASCDGSTDAGVIRGNVYALAFENGVVKQEGQCVVFNRMMSGNAAYNGLKVENVSGIQMPETGGIGTTIFYVVGGTLVLAAAVVLIVRKRAGRDGE